jgi:hypothetical protein
MSGLFASISILRDLRKYSANSEADFTLWNEWVRGFIEVLGLDKGKSRSFAYCSG